MLSAIEKGLQRTSNSFTNELARYRNTSWEELKRRTLEKHRGIVSGDSVMRDSVGRFDAFSRSRYCLAETVNGSVFGPRVDVTLQQQDTPESLLSLDLTTVQALQKVDAMTAVVVNLNESRLLGRRPNLIPALSDAILKSGPDSRSVLLADALKVISAQIVDDEEDGIESVPPRAFRKSYFERKGLNVMDVKITDGSRGFLEGLAWGVVISEVSQHPQVRVTCTLADLRKRKSVGSLV
jgi:hypothetical protein